MLVGIIPIMLIKQGILRSFEEQSITQRGSLVQNQCISLAEELVRSGYLQGNTSEVAEMELSQLAGLYNGRIVIVNSGFRIIKDTYGLDENKLIISEELLKCFQGSRTMRYDEASEFIEMTIPLENDEDQVEGVLVISTLLSRGELEELWLVFLVCLEVVLLVLVREPSLTCVARVVCSLLRRSGESGTVESIPTRRDML